jgi:hypothetical protein
MASRERGRWRNGERARRQRGKPNRDREMRAEDYITTASKVKSLPKKEPHSVKHNPTKC